MNCTPRLRQYMLEYLDFTDSIRCCTFTALSDAEALVYARKVCREARQIAAAGTLTAVQNDTKF